MDQAFSFITSFWPSEKSVYDIQSNMVSNYWDNMDVEVVPYYPLDEHRRLSCGIQLSSSGSTAEYEAFIGKKFGVLDYCLLISDNEQSGAKTIKKKINAEFKEDPIGLVENDYKSWREKQGIGSTRIFGFKKEENIPDIRDLRKRIFHRSSYLAEVGADISGCLKSDLDLISMRGGMLIMTNTARYLAKTIDNTHPARMDIRYADGRGVFAGWQDAAIQKARSHGITQEAASLIDVPLLPHQDNIRSYEDIERCVDAGPLVAMSPFVEKYDKGLDALLIIMKASGLLPAICGITKEPVEIEYLTVENEPVTVEQKAIVIGDEIRTGLNPFGSNLLEDLKVAKKLVA